MRVQCLQSSEPMQYCQHYPMHDLILLFHKMVRWTPTIIALWVCTGVSLISICTIVCFIAIRWVQPLFILIPVAAFTAFAVTASVLTARNSNFHPSAKGSWEQVNAFFINLDSSHDRNANLRKTFAMNRSLTRIPAVTVSQLPSYHISSPMCPLTRPVEFACLLSHLKAIVTAYMSGSQTALILEDDMIVLRWPKWAALTATAPPGWQVLQLFALGASANAIYSDKSAPLWSPRLPETWSAGAYLINRSGMEAVINAVMPGQIATLTWVV